MAHQSRGGETRQHLAFYLLESKLSFHLACQYRGVETRRLLAFQFRGGYRGCSNHQRRGGDSRLHLGFNLVGIMAIIIGGVTELLAISPVTGQRGRHQGLVEIGPSMVLTSTYW